MRWLPFVVLAYVMLGLQIGLGGIAQLGSGSVNFVLIAAVFIAINAPRDPALIACFTLGLLHDIVGIGPIGTYTLAYSLVALLMAGTDRALSIDHPMTHFFVTLFGGVVVAIVVFGVSLRWERLPFWPNLLTAFYSALFSLPVLWGLTKLRKSFRFRTSHR
jgi:rod shape-determining protein MreD